MSKTQHRVMIGATPFLRTQTRQEHQARLIGQDINVPITNIQVVNVYDFFNMPEEYLPRVVEWTLSDPGCKEPIDAIPDCRYWFAYEYIPGQFDQRADSTEMCLMLTAPKATEARVFTSKILCFDADRELSEEEKKRLRDFFINPLSERIKDLDAAILPTERQYERSEYDEKALVCYKHFNQLEDSELEAWRQEYRLAMTVEDLKLVRDYFRSENRAPSEAEIKILDTYWSDHCRHTTFATELEDIRFPASPYGDALRKDFDGFLTALGREHWSLMDLATIDAKTLRRAGALEDVEFSEEINACSVRIDVDEDGQDKPWLLQFKNETHNHPTEIEPYGGASTCIGGAIRDPLAGRAYVYQATRISGSADPREPVAATLPGKLPQRVIARGSALGASSYGNQIGLATGQVQEYYHEGYKAKHLELGAVVGATPADHVQRQRPAPGDLVLLLGGLTGRDGCGGATGSSQVQNQQSLSVSMAEVQNGNAPEERKLQRLFRQKDFATKIKRCNDFGAGGVAVAVGELADGLDIDLDLIPVKYEGLTGTELAISESQERMAIVIDPADEAEVKRLAAAENLLATVIATVSAEKTLKMRWQGQEIVHLRREFLNSNGAKNVQKGVQLPDLRPRPAPPGSASFGENLRTLLRTPGLADQRGLGDRFDHSVGAGAVLIPYGGATQRTPSEANVYLLPTTTRTTTASILAHGFNPQESAANPYLGGLYAVVEATARLVACGGKADKAHYSLQEYFQRLEQDPQRWGQVVAALLGAHHGLKALGRAAIGGKDSMSGSFGDLHVPPTLVAFCVGTVNAKKVISPEFKRAGDYVYWLRCPADELGRPDMKVFAANNKYIHQNNKKWQSVRAIRAGGVALALYESALGNNLGVQLERGEDLFAAEYGGYLLSLSERLPDRDNLVLLGRTTAEAGLNYRDEALPLAELYEISTSTMDEIYPLYPEPDDRPAPELAHRPQPLRPLATKRAEPRVCLPVFFGMNSELDTAQAFAEAGAVVQETVFCNRRHSNDLEESIGRLVAHMDNSEIFVLSGGFSAGDEPDGSAKFIVNVLNNPRLREALERFRQRDGLILGICNGFQALLKSGFFLNGQPERAPELGIANLVDNRIGRHISRIATTVVANNHSPWLRDFAIGQAHDVEFSHGEGQFVATAELLKRFVDQGQVAFQYADPATLRPSYQVQHNPNGSLGAIEGLLSPCGRILGKMGHSERQRPDSHRNFPDLRRQDIFSQGVRAFH